MGDNTELCDLERQVQALQLQLQTTAAARTQHLLDFKTEIISLFEKFQDRLLRQLQSSSSFFQAGLLGPPPPSLSPTPFLQQATTLPSTSPNTPSILGPPSTTSQTQLPPPAVVSGHRCQGRPSLLSLEDTSDDISDLDPLPSEPAPETESAIGFLALVGHHSASSFPIALQNRFGPTEFEDPAGNLVTLQQPTTVLHYQATFATLSSRVTGLSSSLLKGTFLFGLKLLLRHAVTPQRPHDPGGRLDISFLQP